MKTSVIKLSRLIRRQFPAYYSLRRLTLILAVTLVYGVLFIPLHYFWGDGVSLLSAVPVAISGWYFGSMTGIFTCLVILLFNAGLWSASGVISSGGQFLAWLIVNLMTCGLTGYISGQVSKFRSGTRPPRSGNQNDILDRRKWIGDQPADIEAAISGVVDFMPGATLAADRKGEIIAWNPAIESLTTIRAQEIIGKTTSEVAGLIFGKGYRLLIDFILGKSEKLEKEFPGARWEDKDLVLESFFPNFKPGGAYLSQKARPIYNLDGIQVGAIQFLQDVTEVRLAQERQSILGQRDPLTSLATIEYFEKQIAWLEHNQTFPNSILLVRLNNRVRAYPGYASQRR